MKMQLHGSNTQAEVFLSSAYQRIQRITIVLAGMTALVVTIIFGWRSGLGSVVGAIVGYLNLVWLHHSSTVMIERMLAPADKAGSKSRLMVAFIGRYVFLMTIAYVILKGFPSMLFGFTVALFLPVLAAMCEGIYEAHVNVKTDETPDETSLH